MAIFDFLIQILEAQHTKSNKVRTRHHQVQLKQPHRRTSNPKPTSINPAVGVVLHSSLSTSTTVPAPAIDNAADSSAPIANVIAEFILKITLDLASGEISSTLPSFSKQPRYPSRFRSAKNPKPVSIDLAAAAVSSLSSRTSSTI